MLVKNQEVYRAEFSNFDRFCGKNLQTMSANCFSFWGGHPDPLPGFAPGPHMGFPSLASTGSSKTW